MHGLIMDKARTEKKWFDMNINQAVMGMIRYRTVRTPYLAVL